MLFATNHERNVKLSIYLNNLSFPGKKKEEKNQKDLNPWC